MVEGRLSGRVAVVTGAGLGIGRAVAVRLAQEGTRVLVADINEQAGNQTVEHIHAQGGGAVFLKTDVTLEADIARMVSVTIDQYGSLDILVNNAGITPRMPFERATVDYWQHTIDLNLTSLFHAARYAHPHLKQSSNASIINIASMHAFFTVKGMSAYAASKGGVLSLTRSLAVDLAPEVRVNAILPGLIETERVQQALDAETRQRRLAVHPLGRIGQPGDIAAAVVFLASDEATFITGAALPVDGGLTVVLWRE